MTSSAKKLQEKNSDFAALNLTNIRDYQLGRSLGAGVFASVRKATHLLTGMKVAAKIYDKNKLADPTNKKSYLKEVQVLKTLIHP